MGKKLSFTDIRELVGHAQETGGTSVPPATGPVGEANLLSSLSRLCRAESSSVVPRQSSVLWHRVVEGSKHTSTAPTVAIIIA